MARIDINTDKLTILQEIEKLRYKLSQYKTLLGVEPFDKELLKGDKGDKGDKGKAFYYTDFTPEQIAELQRPAAAMIAELTTLQEEIVRIEALRQQAEELRVTQNQESIFNANEARELAIEVVEHPPVIVNEMWLRWNFVTHSYETTGNPSRGKSAYQIWLDEGNTGTKEDFLADIKGDTGKYGETKFVINDNMELEQHTLIGDPLNFSLVDDDLVLTEGGETVNLGTVAIKDTYSYNEIRIGTWINGKHIYRKVFDLSLQNYDGINFEIIHNLGVEQYIKYELICPLNHDEQIIFSEITSNIFGFTVEITNNGYYLILEYTKL